MLESVAVKLELPLRAGKTLSLALLLPAGLVAIAVDFPSVFSRFAHVILNYLWEPLAGVLLAPLAGLCFLFPAIAGPIVFNGNGGRSQSLRVTASCLMIAGVYFLGNPLHFHRNQWLWLDLYLCGQLMATGAVVPKVQPTNWLAFGILALAYVSRARGATWERLNYVWGCYLVLLSVLVWWLPRQDPSTEH
jgi:hypothetical protein